MISGRRASSRSARYFRIGAIIMGVLVVLAVAGFFVVRGTTTSTELAEGVLRIYSKSLLFPDGSNSLAVKTGEGVLLVDTQLPNWTSKVQAAVEERFGLPIVLVINSHWHLDHSGGNEQLTDTATILAHENVLAILSRPHEGFGLIKPGSHHSYDAREMAGLPEQVYSDRLTLPPLASGGSLEAVHYPNAHTDGDSVVYVDDGRIIAVGDIVWPGAFPFVDVLNGGSASGILAAIDRILVRSTGDSLIVTGHREPMSQADLQEYRKMVSGSIRIVQTAMEQGHDLETILKAGLPADYEAFASAVVPEASWITMIYESSPRRPRQ